MLATVEAIKEGRPVRPSDVIQQSRRAVREDLSFRDVAKVAGLEGSQATMMGLVGDLVLDPLWIFTPAKILRAAKLPALARAAKVPQVLQRVKETKPVQTLGRALVTDFGKPQPFIELAERRHREISTATERAIGLGRRIAARPAAEQRAIREYMIAGNQEARHTVLTKSRQAGLDDEAIGVLGAEAMTRDVELGQSLVDVGLMSEQTFQKWRGKHLRREFVKHENPTEYVAAIANRDPVAAARLETRLKQRSGWQGQSSPLRERLEFLKQRQDLPANALKELGEILEAAHPVAKGQALAGQAIATRRFLNEASERFAVSTGREGYQAIPKSAGYGPLAGRYVPDAIHRDLTQLIEKPGQFNRFWRQGVGWWKYNKVVLNPATHARNVMSNFVLADMAGLAPFKVHRYVQGARALTKKDHWYQEAKEAGVGSRDRCNAMNDRRDHATRATITDVRERQGRNLARMEARPVAQ